MSLLILAIVAFFMFAPSAVMAQEVDTTAIPEDPIEEPAEAQEPPVWQEAPADPQQAEAQVDYDAFRSAISDAASQLAALESSQISEVRVIRVEDHVAGLDETQRMEIEPLIQDAPAITDNEALNTVLSEHAVTTDENSDIIGAYVQDDVLFVFTRAQL